MASSEVPAAAFLWRRLLAQCAVFWGVWGAAEGQAAEGQGQGQGRSGWRAVRQGGGGREQQRRGEHVAWAGQRPSTLPSASAGYRSCPQLRLTAV
jgi:hypothetical protein